MSSSINDNQLDITYIYKQQKLYGKVERGQYYLVTNGDFVLANEKVSEIIDILPEGIDLQIMLNSFNAKNPIELLPYLKNTIGDFDFSTLPNKTQFDKPIMSNIALESKFPNVLDCQVDIAYILLHPQPSMDAKQKYIQNLSLSGYQHKLQVNIIDNAIKIGYGDFILKPNSERFYKLPINEHLNVSFMREFGFEVPFNALAYQEYDKEYHYLIKRFDIEKEGNKLPQISLNALMKHTEEEKYKGTIEEISTFLKDRLDFTQKMQFLKFIYANALLHNNDLHKKNIGFIFTDNKLQLSPVYDIINCYAIQSASKFDSLGKNQCVLPIKEHIDGIQISYFRKSCDNLELDFDKVKHSLEEIQHIYLEKYPLYIENLRNIPHTHDIAGFSKKLLESHNKCLKIAKRESKNSSLLSAREQLQAMPQHSAEKKVVAAAFLQTHTILKNTEIQKLKKITQKEYEIFVDDVLSGDMQKLKKAQNIIYVADISQDLIHLLRIDKATKTYLRKNDLHHFRPERKAKYNQSVEKDIIKQLPLIVESAKGAYIDTEHKNFFLAKKLNANKVVTFHFNVDKFGNYIITTRKVLKDDLNKYQLVGSGIEPHIKRINNAALPTVPSPTNLDNHSTIIIESQAIQSKPKLRKRK